MASPLLHPGATVLCLHGGQAQSTTVNPRVQVSRQPTLRQSDPWTVSACPFTVGSAPQPCLTAQWIRASTRVKSGGHPLLLADGAATCTPNAAGLSVVNTQTRVLAQ